jgi:hypothetical protein
VIPAVAVVAVAVAVTAVVASASSGSGGGRGNSYTGGASATVQRRNLVENDTESGTLSYADPQTVYNRLSGTITWLPPVGRVIQPGQPLFKVDQQPVLLMSGKTPAYRDLSPADSAGPDVLELNANLISLGYNPDGIVDNDTWQAATTAGVDALQAAYGETETGTLSLGQVVFLPGPQLVDTLDGTVGSTGGGSSNASLISPVSHPVFVDLTSTGTTPSSTTGTTPAATTTTPSATSTATIPATSPGRPAHGHGHGHGRAPTKTVTVTVTAPSSATPTHGNAGTAGNSGSGSPNSGSGSPNSGSGSPKSSSGNANGGSAGSPSSGSGSPSGGSNAGGTPVEIMQTSSTRLVATVDLAASSQSEAVIGGHVTVEMPNGTTVGGTITSVSAVAQNSSSGNGNGNGGNGGSGSNGSGSSSTVPVTITLDRRVKGAGLDQAAVSVEFAQAKANHVLSVPVTALVATSGSSYAVQEAASPHRLLPVTTGLFAAGYVEISGPGIHPGLRVTDSQG